MPPTLNRTNVELKFGDGNGKPQGILALNRTNVELKCLSTCSCAFCDLTLNRTNVELKSSDARKALLDAQLLIAPMWN